MATDADVLRGFEQLGSAVKGALSEPQAVEAEGLRKQKMFEMKASDPNIQLGQMMKRVMGSKTPEERAQAMKEFSEMAEIIGRSKAISYGFSQAGYQGDDIKTRSINFSTLMKGMTPEDLRKPSWLSSTAGNIWDKVGTSDAEYKKDMADKKTAFVKNFEGTPYEDFIEANQNAIWDYAVSYANKGAGPRGNLPDDWATKSVPLAVQKLPKVGERPKRKKKTKKKSGLSAQEQQIVQQLLKANPHRSSAWAIKQLQDKKNKVIVGR